MVEVSAQDQRLALELAVPSGDHSQDVDLRPVFLAEMGFHFHGRVQSERGGLFQPEDPADGIPPTGFGGVEKIIEKIAAGPQDDESGRNLPAGSNDEAGGGSAAVRIRKDPSRSNPRRPFPRPV